MRGQGGGYGIGGKGRGVTWGEEGLGEEGRSRGYNERSNNEGYRALRAFSLFFSFFLLVSLVLRYSLRICIILVSLTEYFENWL